ncbi:hypothetical protein WOLCODRAFT_156937 [Wolfiporia cocos MD-104 SS10]|uniref:Uncharacterized protein n=1 Tax=Wolfiporia cocos (strain MD-104) TaxID=742152 RepID=A0A2H3J8U4_WOLCO|nr:hypothetical protein WOLCODRAFT_156937 [Wolfiporia cocos MD-104 SS10]
MSRYTLTYPSRPPLCTLTDVRYVANVSPCIRIYARIHTSFSRHVTPHCCPPVVKPSEEPDNGRETPALVRGTRHICASLERVDRSKRSDANRYV